MCMVEKAVLAFERQIERDMLGNLSLISDARRGKPVSSDILADAKRRFADCKAILANT